MTIAVGMHIFVSRWSPFAEGLRITTSSAYIRWLIILPPMVQPHSVLQRISLKPSASYNYWIWTYASCFCFYSQNQFPAAPSRQLDPHFPFCQSRICIAWIFRHFALFVANSHRWKDHSTANEIYQVVNVREKVETVVGWRPVLRRWPPVKETQCPEGDDRCLSTGHAKRVSYEWWTILISRPGNLSRPWPLQYERARHLEKSQTRVGTSLALH